MAKHMRRDALALKHRAILRRDCRRMLMEDAGDAIAGWRLCVTVPEGVPLITAHRHATQPVQRIGRFAPQRQQALLLAFTAQTHLPRWHELEVVPSDARGLAYAGAAVVEEQQQRVVAPSGGRAPVWFGDDRAHVVGFEIRRRLLPSLLRRDRQYSRLLQRAGQVVADQMLEEAADGGTPAVAGHG